MIFIAEIGMNHNGNFGLLHELIRQTKRAGADIAKFQLGWRDGEGEINRITPEVLELIFKLCAYYDIEPMASLITPKAFDLAKGFPFKRYKVASRTVRDNADLVKAIVGEGKETFVSLGMWESQQLPLPADTKNVRYLFCRSLYPTQPWEITDLPKNFDTSPFDGYSDHTIGIETVMLAISRGARVVEKHFTLDKSDTTIRDHALSATPDEFRQMVDIGRGIRRCLDVGQ